MLSCNFYWHALPKTAYALPCCLRSTQNNNQWQSKSKVGTWWPAKLIYGRSVNTHGTSSHISDTFDEPALPMHNTTTILTYYCSWSIGFPEIHSHICRRFAFAVQRAQEQTTVSIAVWYSAPVCSWHLGRWETLLLLTALHGTTEASHILVT